MSNAIEIEAKVLLQKEDYEKLAHSFRSEPRYTQTNYYIDSEDRILSKEGIASPNPGKGRPLRIDPQDPA
jgi:uncharacterized protein YjbK